MPLNIADSLTRFGVAGTSGSSGANGTSLSRDGVKGGRGTNGQDATLNVSGTTFTGDPGGDTISFSRSTTGGSGGSGGLGGTGAAAEATVSTSSGPNFSQTDVIFDGAGTAGAAGLAGLAGDSTIRYSGLTFDLGLAIGTQDTIRMTASAVGGQGGAGGTGGGGGSSGATFNDTNTSVGPPIFTTIYSQLGGQGFDGASGAAGADGGMARTVFSLLNVTGDNVAMTISGAAFGFAGGQGGHGGRGGGGSTAGNGGFGGAGGDGAEGLARLDRLTMTVSGGINLQVTLDATGGQGANGGSGNLGGVGTNTTITSNNTSSSQVTNHVHGTSGAGGAGGDGGNGIAEMRASTISGSAAVDNVYIGLSAHGGLAGTGGNGANGVANSSVSSGNATTNTVGTAPGAQGLNGIAGAALAEMRNVTISLGGGDDTLTISLLANGTGTNTVTFASNSFDGGLGLNDRLSLGIGIAGEQSAIVNVGAGTLRMGTGSGGTIAGFEDFRGTSGNDRFIDGIGSQRYSGSFGSDTFVFSAAQTGGTDTISGFETQDVIRLAGFGPSLNSFNDVMNNTMNFNGGALINLGGANTLFLAGINMATLTANDFTF